MSPPRAHRTEKQAAAAQRARARRKALRRALQAGNVLVQCSECGATANPQESFRLLREPHKACGGRWRAYALPERGFRVNG